MEKLVVSTNKEKEIIDLTEQIELVINHSQKKEGVIMLFITHTTAGLTTADLDPGTDLDMLDAFDQIIPHLAYRHPHDPKHVKDHIMSSIIGSQLLMPFEDGKLILGTWQRPVIVELNGPRSRTIYVKFIV